MKIDKTVVALSHLPRRSSLMQVGADWDHVLTQAVRQVLEEHGVDLTFLHRWDDFPEPAEIYSLKVPALQLSAEIMFGSNEVRVWGDIPDPTE